MTSAPAGPSPAPGRRHIIAALLLNALPALGAVYLVVMGCLWAAYWLVNWSWMTKTEWPWLPIPLAMVIQALWGLGYLMLPGYASAFGRTIGLALLVNGLIVCVMVVVVYVATAVDAPRSHWFGQLMAALVYTGWIGWGLANVIAGAIIWRRTWRLAAGAPQVR